MTSQFQLRMYSLLNIASSLTGADMQTNKMAMKRNHGLK